MDQPPRLSAHEVGIMVVMLLTAVIAGISIGWLFSPRIPPLASVAPNRITATAPVLSSTALVITAIAQVPEVPPIVPTSSSITPTTPIIVSKQSPVEQLPASAASTVIPLALPTAAPTSTTTVVPIPAATGSALPVAQDPAVVLLQQIAAAESGLQMGALEATLHYSDGYQAVAHVRFDLGTDRQPARLDFRTTYQGTSNPHTVETIVVGERAWERQNAQAWQAVEMPKGLWDQIQFFLPRAQLGIQPQITRQNGETRLSWYDPSRDADTTLLVDSERTVPHEMQRHIRSTGVSMTVTYVGWGLPIAIQPPAGF